MYNILPMHYLGLSKLTFEAIGTKQRQMGLN